jgi:outer membrane protein OmpA-like peptidoglycan-associated protein
LRPHSVIALLLATVASASPRIVPHKGLTLSSALKTASGDRENLVRLEEVTPEGVLYGWRATEKHAERTFTRWVRSEDLARATRLDTLFQPGERTERPGFTAFTISTAIYDQLQSADQVPFGLASFDTSGAPAGPLGLSARPRVILKGPLTKVGAQPVPFPLLINGRREQVQALRLRGLFALEDRTVEHQLWVLADREHPLILKSILEGDVLQLVRVETLQPDEALAVVAQVERALTETCTAELPGVYFAFGTAELSAVSDRMLAEVARLLAQHPDWKISIEGHTDNVGTAAANQALSLKRAEAVRARLTSVHQVAAARLSATGHGSSRQREDNSTLEGRARNRRVELVRACPAK